MNVFEIFAKLGLDSSEYNSGLDKASGKASSFASKVGNGFKTLGKVGVATMAATTAAVTAFSAASVKTGMSFDSSMSQVAATMGKTVDEISELRDFAQEMGAKTAFSATQAADALNYMALAGYDAETSMAMLPNVLNLAAAGNIDLAYASDMVTDSQSALGLSLEETSSLVDKMAQASSKSNTSVAQLGEAILQIGGTAKNLSGGTTELATALGILADNGIKGAEGGTALRNIINSLAAPTNTASKLMDELGLSVFDTEGNMRSMNDIFLDLNSVMSDMTQEERVNVISTLFNARDMKSAEALLANVGDRWEELSGYIDDAQGAAQKMADTQLDNLAGDITLFKSALEGAQIVLSDKLTPSLRGFVQFGTDGISKITDAFKEGGLQGGMEALGEVLSNGVNMIIDMAPKLIEAAITLLEAFGKGLIDNAPKLIDAALQIVIMLSQSLIDNLPQMLKAGLELILQLALGIGEALPELIPAIVDVIIEIVETLLDNIDLIIEAAGKLIIGLAEGLMNALPTLLMKLPEIIVKIVSGLLKGVSELNNVGLQLIKGLIEGIANSLPAIFVGIANFVKEVINQFKKLFGIHSPSTVFADMGKFLIQGLVNGILSLSASVIKAVVSIGTSIKDSFSSLISGAATWGRDMIDGFIGGIKEKFGALKDTVSGVAQGIKDFLHFSEPDKGPLSNFHTYAPDMMKLFAEGIRNNENIVTDQIAKSFDFGNVITAMPAIAGGGAVGGTTTSYGGVTINVYGAQGQSERELADAVYQRFIDRIEREKVGAM